MVQRLGIYAPEMKQIFANINAEVDLGPEWNMTNFQQSRKVKLFCVTLNHL